MANEFSKIEGSGLLQNYQEAGTQLEDALRKRRQKLAEDKIHLDPTTGDESEQ